VTAQASRTDLLVLAAHAPELVGLRERLGDGLAGEIGERRVAGRTVGVGMPAAGAGTMRHLAAHKPAAVVLLGSCGHYVAQYAPTDLMMASKLVLVDTSVCTRQAAFPEPMQTEVAPDPVLTEGLLSATSGVRRGPVATTLAITTHDGLAQTLGARSGCHVENLEAFSVGLACAALEIPCAVLLGVTNAVGSRGRAQWAQYQRQMAETTAKLLLTWLDRGGPGLPR